MMNLSTLTLIKILIATKNPGKAREIKDFLGSNFEFVSLSDFKDVPDVEETGKTFEENAALKATKYFEWAGIPAIADDAGLEIDFLNGEPGVKSRRWLGYEMKDQEMIDTALDKLKDVPKEKRAAHLRTVGVYFDGKNILTETAAIDGYITEEQTTECQPGYPFRSIFWIPKFEKLYQDLTREEHEQINHRKVVYGKLVDKILKLEKQ